MAFEKIKSAFVFKSETKANTLASPEAFGLFGAVPTASGIQVSAQSAMRVPAVACAVSLIAESVGCLPAKTYQRSDKQAAKDHPAYSLVHEQANDWTSAEALRTTLTTDALLTGNGFAAVTRLSDGTPYELHRLDPAKVRCDTAPDGEPIYTVSTDAGPSQHSY